MTSEREARLLAGFSALEAERRALARLEFDDLNKSGVSDGPEAVRLSSLSYAPHVPCKALQLRALLPGFGQ